MSSDEIGYCLAYRKAWTHPAFKDLREAAIWNFLYQNAFYEDGERNFNGHVFHLKRGQIVTTPRFLAKGFGMTEKGARVVIQKLEKLGMLVKQGASKGTIITICNYDKYQLSGRAEGDQEGKQRAIKGRSKGANNKKETKEERNKMEKICFFGSLNWNRKMGKYISPGDLLKLQEYENENGEVTWTNAENYK